MTERDMMFRVLAESERRRHEIEGGCDRKLRRLIAVNKENKPVGTLDQRMFLTSLVNVLVDEPELAYGGRGFIERYVQDIAENFPEPC